MYFVYELFDPETGEVYYVGKGKGDRPKDHLKEALAKKDIPGNCRTRKENKILKLLSEGKEYSYRITFRTEEESESFRVEKETIKKYGRRDLGNGTLTNLSEGGEGNSGYKFTPAQRGAYSDMVKGSGNPMHGKFHSKATREKISAISKGKVISEEARRKISAANTGRKTPESTKLLIGARLQGVPKSESHKEKLREANLGKIQEQSTKDKIREANSRLKWYTNGRSNLRLPDGAVPPEGFRPGRSKKSSSD